MKKKSVLRDKSLAFTVRIATIKTLKIKKLKIFNMINIKENNMRKKSVLSEKLSQFLQNKGKMTPLPVVKGKITPPTSVKLLVLNSKRCLSILFSDRLL
jgi:hypothetical protein